MPFRCSIHGGPSQHASWQWWINLDSRQARAEAAIPIDALQYTGNGGCTWLMVCSDCDDAQQHGMRDARRRRTAQAAAEKELQHLKERKRRAELLHRYNIKTKHTVHPRNTGSAPPRVHLKACEADLTPGDPAVVVQTRNWQV